MSANDHPGCCGVAARLPYRPGSQKLTPPSAASAMPEAAASAPRARTPPALQYASHVITGVFINSPVDDDTDNEFSVSRFAGRLLQLPMADKVSCLVRLTFPGNC